MDCDMFADLDNLPEDVCGNPPIIYGEICICFDYDFHMGDMNNVFPVSATRFCRQSQTRINPITKCHNPGYWEYCFSPKQSYDCESTILELHQFISTYHAEFQKIICEYKPSDLFLRIRIQMNERGEYPAIRFSKDFLKAANSIFATIDILLEDTF